MQRTMAVRVSGEPGTAVVSDTLSGPDLESATAWRPYVTGQDDDDWDWCAIAAAHPKGTRFDHLGIHRAGTLEGLAILEVRVGSRFDTGSEVTGIVYLAAGPGNRKTDPSNPWPGPRVTPVGKVLVLASILQSRDSGNGGRLCWHSAPGAEAWYRDLFPEIRSLADDPDDPENPETAELLTYFELSTAQADAFVAANGFLLHTEVRSLHGA